MYDKSAEKILAEIFLSVSTSIVMIGASNVFSRMKKATKDMIAPEIRMILVMRSADVAMVT